MKDGKICFNKTLVYLVLLLVVVVAGFLVMNKANTSNIGSIPKAAAGDCAVSVSGINYLVPNQGCLKDLVPGYENTSYICNNGSSWGKSNLCNPVTAATGCSYKAYGQTFAFAVGTCLKDAAAVNGVNPPTSSEKCLSVGYAPKDPSCGSVTQAPTCTPNQITNYGKNSDGSLWCQYMTGQLINGKCVQNYKSGAVCGTGTGLLTVAAAGYDCTYSYGGHKYGALVSDCFAGSTSIDGSLATFPTNMSEGCVSTGVVRKIPACAPSAASTPTCVAGQIDSYNVNALGVAECTYELGPTQYSGMRCLVGYTSGTACQNKVGGLITGSVAATGCSIPYNQQVFQLKVGDCLKSQSAVNGVNPPIDSTKCISTNYYAKDISCAPTCGELSCSGGSKVGSCFQKNVICNCVNTTSTTEKPSLFYSQTCP